MSKNEAMMAAALAFAGGMPIQEAMTIYDVCYASIYNTIKRHNIPYVKTFGRTVTFNQEYFECIDTKEKAYFLGLIWSDGTIQKTDSKCSSYNRLSFSQCINDRILVDQFANVLNYSGDVKIYENRYVILQLNSMKMIDDLIKLGYSNIKLNRSFIPLIPKNLIRHFIRGYFDGDGCMSVYENHGKLKGEFSITSSLNILSEIQIIFNEELGIKNTKMKSYKNKPDSYSLRYGGIDAIHSIFNYLYEDTDLYLSRKYDNFSLLLSQ